MNVDGAQRWRSGRASYRPAGEHTGNLRYLFGLTPSMKRLVASSTSYPPQPYPQISVPRPRS